VTLCAARWRIISASPSMCISRSSNAANTMTV
jgi:hypothetical protein